tara:strand:- start:6163 stop:7734 length:1572 start_codon:yes stop_codon:yes gene_type:complete
MNNIEVYGILNSKVYYNLSVKELYKITIHKKQGLLTSNDVLSVNTGKFTGRSPKDRYFVKDKITSENVLWSEINKPVKESVFNLLYKKVTKYLSGKELYVRDSCACAIDKYQINIRTICELAWNDLFIFNMFIREKSTNQNQDWTIISAPNFKADPQNDNIESENFSIINFSKKIILIGGTAYTGEIKKGIFSVLNFILPKNKNVLPMHCSANFSKNGETSIFFGLSGTGKTTLSTEKGRNLIGDDEHGWDQDNNIFNFEGGCYAKVLNLSQKDEPDIFNAIKPGALLENVILDSDGVVDYKDKTISQNTRVSYPIHHIKNIATPSIGNNPKNIFFLTADAFGVLPPISMLSSNQAAYHFISGYTSKLAGTEIGVDDPIPIFSACFGSPFMPLNPLIYADMLIKKIEKSNVKTWLVNTGWIGGPFGVGRRIDLKYTRAMINAANNGVLDKINSGKYNVHPVFNFLIPKVCPNVPDEILSQKNLWKKESEYHKNLNKLALHFKNNFKKFESFASNKIIIAGPNI